MSDALHIVVVEPEGTARRTLASLVKAVVADTELRVTVHEASSGTEALTACSEHKPRLLIGEVLLEGLSGLALLRRLKAESGDDTAVVFVTNLARENDRYWGLRNGALAYFAKPYDEAALKDRVRRILTEGVDAKADTPRPL